jgi:predicted PurR-regulated permease PerM
MTLKNGFSSSDGAAFAEWMSIYNKCLSSSLHHPPMLGRTVLFIFNASSIVYNHCYRLFFRDNLVRKGVRMRIVLDKTYVKYSTYTILTVTILYILYSIISNLGIILKAVANGLGVVFSALSPLIIALVIAYLLHPLVSWIDRIISKYIKPLAADADNSNKYQHLRRTLSVLITYLFFLFVLVLLVYGLYILISGSLPRHLDLNSMILAIGNYSQTYNELFNRLITYIQTAGFSEGLKNQLLGFIILAQNFIGDFISGLFSSLQRGGNNLLAIMMGVVISFYLLKDIEYFNNLYHECTVLLFNRSHNEKLSGFLTEVNGVVGNFIRGQLLVALIVGVFSSIALYLVGLDYAVLVGMTVGLCDIIPYFGPVVGSVIAVIVALVTGSPMKALLAVVALWVVQQLEGNIIAPKIIGKRVGLHPVFIILAIVIGGYFFGLVGMLLAVPTAGITKLILLRYKDAYYGAPEPAVPEGENHHS